MKDREQSRSFLLDNYKFMLILLWILWGSKTLLLRMAERLVPICLTILWFPCIINLSQNKLIFGVPDDRLR